MASIRFQDKVVLITGAASGIGRETSIFFAREGARLSLFDLSGEGLRRTSEEVSRIPGKAITTQGNVADLIAVEKCVADTEKAFGGIDILFNNAGYLPRHSIVEMPVEVYDRIMDANLKGVFLFTKHVAPVMIRKREITGQGSSIVNMSSMSGLVAQDMIAAYSAAKAAVIMLTKTSAIELAKYGIRVNCVCPGHIDTPQFRGAALEPAEVIASKVPLGRIGSAEEVARVVMFLASDEASYMTGSAVVIDGGRTITIP